MTIFIRPGPVCAADRRESRFDNAFDRANNLAFFDPLPTGLCLKAGTAHPDGALTWGQMFLRQYDSGVKIFPDFIRNPAASSAQPQNAKELSGLAWVRDSLPAQAPMTSHLPSGSMSMPASPPSGQQAARSGFPQPTGPQSAHI